MRAIFVILIVGVLALIAAIASGLIDIRQTREATAPTVQTQDGKIVTKAGQTPSFDVETGSIGVGAGKTKVNVPSVEIKREGKTVGLPGIEVRPPADANNVNSAQ